LRRLHPRGVDRRAVAATLASAVVAAPPTPAAARVHEVRVDADLRGSSVLNFRTQPTHAPRRASTGLAWMPTSAEVAPRNYGRSVVACRGG
jgi:hypothetical protein